MKFKWIDNSFYCEEELSYADCDCGTSVCIGPSDLSEYKKVCLQTGIAFLNATKLFWVHPTSRSINRTVLQVGLRPALSSGL